jgi:arginine-tRNA-protein transferase
MFHVFKPEELSGAQLDLYLGRGYYRHGQRLFTESAVIMDTGIFRVYWLRLRIDKIKENKKIKKRFRKNADLQVTIRPFTFSKELIELYELYKASIDFQPAESLVHYLLDDEYTNIFDTYIIEIRDGDKLVAAGIYDNGDTTAAAIINFYHPDYKNRGLGIYLYFLEIEEARRANKIFFYPGYVADGNPKFDYKVLPGLEVAEMYDYNGEGWVPFSWEEIRELGKRKKRG